jgi:hypothetical protein
LGKANWMPTGSRLKRFSKTALPRSLLRSGTAQQRQIYITGSHNGDSQKRETKERLFYLLGALSKNSQSLCDSTLHASRTYPSLGSRVPSIACSKACALPHRLSHDLCMHKMKKQPYQPACLGAPDPSSRRPPSLGWLPWLLFAAHRFDHGGHNRFQGFA